MNLVKLMPTEVQVSADQSPRDYKLASAVASHAGLHNICLMSISAELKEPLADAIASLSAGTAEVGIGWRANHEISESGLVLNVKLDFKVDFGQKPIVAVTCAYLLEYHLDSPPPADARDDLLSAFAKVNGVYNAWPYLREVVQNTCARMNLPPMVLPVFRVIRPSKKDLKANDATVQERPKIEETKP